MQSFTPFKYIVVESLIIFLLKNKECAVFYGDISIIWMLKDFLIILVPISKLCVLTP